MKKILLAEDDRISRVMLQAVLMKWGYQVESVQNGEEALHKLLDPNGPCLAILDWMMPAPDGVEVCRRLRDTPGIRHLHIILLTSKSKGADAAAALGVGADDHVAKPYDLVELQARIELGFRRIRWARDCATGYLRPQQVQGLLEVNRLAMLQLVQGGAIAAQDRKQAVSSSLGATISGMTARLGSALSVSGRIRANGPDCQIPTSPQITEQLFANLFCHWNALMPEGGSIEIDWVLDDPPGRVRIRCVDDAPVPPEVQILSGALPSSGDGRIVSGMGILFAKALAESFGGNLAWERSPGGRGLRIDLDLPVLAD